MNNHELLRLAIAGRKQVVAHYKGYRREFCPHVLGSSTVGLRVLVYQFGGAGSRGPIAGPEEGDWRCLEVDQLVGVELRDGDWHTGRATGTKRQSCVEIVEAEVGPGDIALAARRGR